MASSIKPGQPISRLVIRNILNKGGMATVVRASSPDRREDIALKIARPDKPDDPFFGSVLVREVEVMRRLHAPGVVRILPMTWERKPDIYNAVALELRGTPPYYAMDLLHGPSLEKYLKSVRVTTPGDAAAIGHGVARILDEVHRQGFVHNDVKLDNVVFRDSLTIGGAFVPVLIDFGVTVKHKNTTFDGLTPSYAAPEKLEIASRQKPPEHIEYPTKTDIWSMGVALYQCLSGKLPFPGRSVRGVLTSIRRRRLEAIRNRQRNVPRELEEMILHWCLAEKPEQRPTARQLADGLAHYAGRSGVEKVGRSGWFRRK